MSPETRREVWLSVALAVARDGLPAPASFSVYGSGPNLDFATVTEAQLWGETLGLQRLRLLESSDGLRLIHRWTGQLAGIWWSITGTETKPSSAAEALAAQVVDAIVGNTEAGDQ